MNIKQILISLSLLVFVCGIYAQDVNVKYRGPVNVDNGHFVEYPLKQSSIVKAIYYDEPNEYLLVSLNGTFYHYCSIPMYVVNDWVGAPSLGGYYNAKVKGGYDCRINPTPEYR
jgi:hypothetical protein